MPAFLRDIANGFSAWQVALLLALQGMGFAIWLYQNSRPGRLGGAISLIKAHWLSYAIVLWLVVPILLAPRHWSMASMAASVALRAIIEVPLCLRGHWKVAYGMAHNWLHLGLCSSALIWMAGNGQADGFLGLIITLTILSLLTEMLFVRWFSRATGGPDAGVYFVPAGSGYRRINRATAWIFLPQYAIFLSVIAVNLARILRAVP